MTASELPSRRLLIALTAMPLEGASFQFHRSSLLGGRVRRERSRSRSSPDLRYTSHSDGEDGRATGITCIGMWQVSVSSLPTLERRIPTPDNPLALYQAENDLLRANWVPLSITSTCGTSSHNISRDCKHASTNHVTELAAEHGSVQSPLTSRCPSLTGGTREAHSHGTIARLAGVGRHDPMSRDF